MVAVEWAIVERLMRPVVVVMVQVFFDQMPKMVLAEDEEVIEAFDLERLQPALHERVHVGGARTRPHHFDIFRLKNRVEANRELCVVVADQVSRLVSFIVEVHREIPSLLGHPGPFGLVVIPAMTTRREPTWMKNRTK